MLSSSRPFRFLRSHCLARASLIKCTVFFCIHSFSSLESPENSVALQDEVLGTLEEHTHQAMPVVLKDLGREEEAEMGIELAGESTKTLDSQEVPLESLETPEVKEWAVSDPVPISSRPAGKCRK